MERIRIIATILPILLLGAAEMSGQARLVHFTTETEVLLRWVDPDPAEAEGYDVYRSDDGGDWQKVNAATIGRVYSEKEIEEIAGYETDLYLALFGATEPRDLTEADYRRAFTDEDAGLLRALLLVNPEFGELLGETFADDVPSGQTVRYRIERISAGSSQILVESDAIVTGQVEEVPRVAGLDGLAGDRTAVIEWTKDRAALDEGRVVSWNVYRADSPLGPFLQVNTAGITPFSIVGEESEGDDDRGSYRDEWLENGRSYYYQVRSVNLFGIESSPSHTIEVVPGPAAPAPPQGITIRRSGDHLLLGWSVDSGSRSGVEIERSVGESGSFERRFVVAPLEQDRDRTEWIDTEVEEGGTYRYVLRTIGENLDRSLPSDTITFTIDDATPPAAPTGVRAVGGSDGITITWSASPEPDVVGYEVERASDRGYTSFGLLNGEQIVGTSWLDAVDPQIETTFGYVVYAIDRSFNRSQPSNMVLAAMPDIVPPQQPIITRLEMRGDSVELDWTPSPARDLAGWRVDRAIGDGPFEPLATIDAASTTMHHLPSDEGTVRYTVTALDSTGNASDPSTEAVIEIVRTRTLPAPARLTIEEEDSYRLLRWDVVPDAAGYTVEWIESSSGRRILLDEPDASTTSYRDSRPERTASGTYVVRAHDRAWVLGAAARVDASGS